jgi:hypothetical protein
MKMTRLFTVTLMLGALVLLGASKASAQAGIAPSSQLGIGVFTGGNFTGGGATIQYAINPSFQIGLALGILGVSQSGNSTTAYSTEIYGRFVLEGTVNPFIQASFRRTSQDVTVGTTTSTVTGNSLSAGFGLEYFLNRNAAVFAMIDVIDLDFDPSRTGFGFNSGRVGVEWYFNP